MSENPAGNVDGAATFAAEKPAPVTDSVTEDIDTYVRDTDTVVHDVGKDVTDIESRNVAGLVNDGSVTLEDIHRIVSDIHHDISSLKDVVTEVKPHLETIMADVKEKGLAGIIPAIMQAFKS